MAKPKHVHIHVHDAERSEGDQFVAKYTQKINQVLAEARRDCPSTVDFPRFLKYLSSLLKA